MVGRPRREVSLFLGLPLQKMSAASKESWVYPSHRVKIAQEELKLGVEACAAIISPAACLSHVVIANGLNTKQEVRYRQHCASRRELRRMLAQHCGDANARNGWLHGEHA
jgi:hypothetical protein